LITIAIAIIVLGAAVFLAAIALRFNVNPAALIPQSARSDTPEPNQTEQPTPQSAYGVQSWSTYSVSQDGFSFDYPSTWKVDITDEQQPDSAVTEHQELTVHLITDVPDENGTPTIWDLFHHLSKHAATAIGTICANGIQ